MKNVENGGHYEYFPAQIFISQARGQVQNLASIIFYFFLRGAQIAVYCGVAAPGFERIQRRSLPGLIAKSMASMALEVDETGMSDGSLRAAVNLLSSCRNFNLSKKSAKWLMRPPIRVVGLRTYLTRTH